MNEVFVRKLLQLPESNQLSIPECLQFRRLEAACEALRARDTHAIGTVCWVREAARRLEHPLQPIALRNGGPIANRPGTLNGEARAAAVYGRQMLNALRSTALPMFKRLAVRALCETGDQVKFRTCSASLNADTNGNRIEFPAVCHVDEQLTRAGRYLAGNQSCPSLCALVLQVAILNLHPLNDGNGRLSRILCGAALMEPSSASGYYLSVYELRRFAPYRFEIALRAAELHGNWTDLAEVYIQLAESYLDKLQPPRKLAHA